MSDSAQAQLLVNLTTLTGVAVEAKLSAIYAQREALRSIIQAAILADPDSTAARILRTVDLEAKV